MNKRDYKGITLIALVITIIVLLILAGISITMLAGDNSILQRATESNEKMEYGQIEENIKLKCLEYISDKFVNGANGLYEYFYSQKGKDGIDDVTDNGDGTITVANGKYNFIIDKDGVILDISVRADIEITQDTSTDSKKVTITVTVKNASELGGIDSIKLINPITGAEETATKTEGATAIFEVTSNGDYTVEVKIKDVENPKIKTATVNTIIVAFETTYGKIDVIWVDKNNNIIRSPLKAEDNLNGLTPIKLDSDGSYTKNPTTTWYNYKAGTGTADNRESEWANAINPDDESFFVWIPRYAYRITYYNDNNQVTGYFDGRGMVDYKGDAVTYANGATITKKETTIIKKGVETKIQASLLDDNVSVVEQDGKSYIVHPAFETNKELGGWRSELAGIWVAKYEMSRENYDSSSEKWIPQGTANYGGGDTVITDTNKASIRAVSKPNTSSSTVSSWRYINIGYCYTNSYNYDRNKESHLMKNSEWGAVAYLTQSQYGRNGNEIRINNNSSHLTGSAAKTKDASGTTNTNAYNTSDGMLASSTGNITGIYDLSGGSDEYLAAFNYIEDGNKLVTNNGNSFTTTKNETGIKSSSDEYATKYNNSGSAGDGISLVYSIGKTGDATKEVRTNKNSKNWFGDGSYLIGSNCPFITRGGDWGDGSETGVFCSFYGVGQKKEKFSYRVVLAQ